MAANSPGRFAGGKKSNSRSGHDRFDHRQKTAGRVKRARIIEDLLTQEMLDLD